MAEKEKSKGGKTKKMLLGAIALVALTGSGAGAGFYFANSTAEQAVEDPNRPKLVTRESVGDIDPDASKPTPRVGTVSVESDLVRPDPGKYAVGYIPIDENFTSNLSGGKGFIQVNVSLSTYYDDRVARNVARQMVPIRSAVLMVLSEQEPDIVARREGKRRMQEELTAEINRVLREKEGFGGIDNVYFSNFVIQ